MINIGINNPVENYLEAMEEHKPELLGMSALLTTTMPYMKVVIDTLKEQGVRDDYMVMVGGAPLNEAFGEAIGADAYCRRAKPRKSALGRRPARDGGRAFARQMVLVTGAFLSRVKCTSSCDSGGAENPIQGSA